MNLRRKQPADSLYLLLDTLCNAFGGIILLAVLVVLLTSKEKVQTSTSADSQEMLQRQLEMAKNDLQKAQQLAAKLQSQAADPNTRSQVDLLRSRKDIQDAIRQIRDADEQAAKDLESASAVDPAERLKFLNAQLADAEAKKLYATNSLTVATEEKQHLTIRVTNLEIQVTTKAEEQQRPLRLPKEHDTGKQVIYIIARYNKIYACRYADQSRNTIDINWFGNMSGEIANPIPEKGIDPFSNPAAMAGLLQSMSGGTTYVAFCVYEDSFPAFIRAKQVAANIGLAYAWEPWLIADGPVGFSAFGHSPKPQ